MKIKFAVPQSIIPHVPGTKESFKRSDGTEVTVSFKEFCENCLLSDPRWVRTFADVKAAMNFSSQLDEAEIALDAADYEKLKACVETPSNGYQGYHPIVIQQLFPFMDAILKAE